MSHEVRIISQNVSGMQKLFACLPRVAACYAILAASVLFAGSISSGSGDTPQTSGNVEQAALRLVGYFERMSEPKPFLVRTGKDWEAHREAIRRRILKDINLDPLPERIPLDPHYSEPIEHPWCTIRKVAFQLWPGVYSRGLLFMPRELPEKPAPAVLCAHGHTHDGYADTDEQRRYLPSPNWAT